MICLRGDIYCSSGLRRYRHVQNDGSKARDFSCTVRSGRAETRRHDLRMGAAPQPVAWATDIDNAATDSSSRRIHPVRLGKGLDNCSDCRLPILYRTLSAGKGLSALHLHQPQTLISCRLRLPLLQRPACNFPLQASSRSMWNAYTTAPRPSAVNPLPPSCGSRIRTVCSKALSRR